MIAAKMPEPAVDLIGCVRRVLSIGVGGGAIFSVTPLRPEQTLPVRIVANFDVMPEPPMVGEIWGFTGRFVHSETFGTQFEAGDAHRVRPSGQIVIDFLANNPRFVGVGRQTAVRLWAALGESLYEALDSGDEDALVASGVRHVHVARAMVETWRQYVHEIEVIRFLQVHQLPPRLARRAINCWGVDTVERIAQDPYRLLAFAPWSQVDAAALKTFNVAPDADLRLAAACEATLYEAYDERDTAMNMDSLLRYIREKVADRRLAQRAIDLAVEDHRAVHLNRQGRLLVQSFAARALESSIECRIKDMLRGESGQLPLFPSGFSIDSLDRVQRSIGLALSPDQMEAVKLIFTHAFAAILGGAGTGKTTILRAIYAMISTEPIVQVTLSGRAAVRLREATGHLAMTIATFLARARADTVAAPICLFIDEASMLDVPTFSRILRHLAPGSRVYLIGDPHQLPPIGPGLVLHVIAGDASIPQKELTVIHRQALETGIPPAAASIRERRAPSLMPYAPVAVRDHGASFVPAKPMPDAIERVISEYREVSQLTDAQIIAPTLKLCETLNLYLHNENYLQRKSKGLPSPVLKGPGADPLTLGDKVLYHSRNLPDRCLYNGSLGTVIRIYDTPEAVLGDDGELVSRIMDVEFDTAGAVSLTAEDLDYIRLGYAITLHKAQGSQWTNVIVLAAESRLIDNSWFYTALTRAQRRVTVIGSPAVFREAIAAAPRSFDRVVGLAFH